MQLISNEIQLSSSLYGEYTIIDRTKIFQYITLDRSWLAPPAANPNISSFLGERDTTKDTSLWCVKMDGLKKSGVTAVNSFYYFPNHTQEDYRDGSRFCLYRINPLIENTDESVAMIRALRLLHWRLIDKPKIYVYTYVENNNPLICTNQVNEFFDKFKTMNTLTYVKTYPQYDDSGKTLGFATFNPQESYNKLVAENLIDEQLTNSIESYLSSVGK